MSTRHITNDGPLEGTVVVDLGQIYAGPYCTHLLRALGATVIKVEPFDGEPIRWRSEGDALGQAFVMLNAGKYGMRMDLKSDRGRHLFFELLDTADVVVENFAPGVMERLGIGWDAIHSARPSVVLASVRAYGDHPKSEGLRGMDVTVQAMTGIVSTTGFPDGPPVKTGPAVVDFAAGSHLATAVLAALLQRCRTGVGQHVRVAMQDAILPTLTSNIAGMLESPGDFMERTGNAHGGRAVCPYNVYPTRDGWLAILCLRPKQWNRLCDLMERQDLSADPALATPAGRVAQMDRVDAAVAEWTQTVTTADAFDALQLADIPAAPVRSLAEVVNDPVLRDRGMLVAVGDGERAALVLGCPLQIGSYAAPEPHPAPLLGEHTEIVLAERLGLSDDDIDDLRRDGIV
jgi:crotonobetainyl-CoA:carnitine CoA-transferase CaiB-like acyl-CoA transferase